MKIEITLAPVFWIYFTVEQVNLLSKWARLHYDSVCNASAREGGFIYGWQNTLDFDKTNSCKATWIQCDITLKICESIIFGMPEEEKVICKEITKSINAAMDASKNLTNKTLELS